MRCQVGISSDTKPAGIHPLPYACTEQGISLLSDEALVRELLGRLCKRLMPGGRYGLFYDYQGIYPQP